jgi:hypothetical protein
MFDAGELPAPDQVPCTCGGTRDEHGGTRHLGRLPARQCRGYRADPVVQLAALAAHHQGDGLAETMHAYDRATRGQRQKRKPGDFEIGPSGIGACRRSIFYKITPPEDFVPAVENKRPAWMGTLIHEEFLRRRARVYWWRLYGDQPGMEITLPGGERGFRYDEYDPITGELISTKTAGGWRWDKTDAEGADDKWWDQDHLYAMALIERDMPVKTITIHVINRENGSDELFSMPYDPERAERALDRLTALSTQLEMGLVPPRDESGPTTSGLCRNCFARNHCWSIPQAEAAGVTPERYTVLGMTPADRDVELVATEYVQVNRTKLDAEKRVKELKAILDGVEFKPYGEVEPAWTSGTGTAWNDYVAEVERLWNAPANERPTLPPKPRKTTSKGMTWKLLTAKTRKAMEKARKAEEARKLAEATVDLTEELEAAS